MKNIIELLHIGGYSCVVLKDSDVRCFTQPGVADLLDLLNYHSEFLQEAIVADKVVGKGAAALMIQGGVKQVYAEVISTSAIELFAKHGVCVTFEKKTPYIKNREQSGICPLEKLCLVSDSVHEIIPLIEQFRERMRK